MNDIVYHALLGAGYSAFFCALARWTYGSWPWESRKTWYWTGPEIEYLRDVQETARCKIASLEQRIMQRRFPVVREKGDN